MRGRVAAFLEFFAEETRAPDPLLIGHVEQIACVPLVIGLHCQTW